MRPLPYTSTVTAIPFYTVLAIFVLCEWRISVKSGRNRVVLPTVGLVVRIGEPYRRFAATRKRLISLVW